MDGHRQGARPTAGGRHSRCLRALSTIHRSRRCLVWIRHPWGVGARSGPRIGLRSSAVVRHTLAGRRERVGSSRGGGAIPIRPRLAYPSDADRDGPKRMTSPKHPFSMQTGDLPACGLVSPGPGLQGPRRRTSARTTSRSPSTMGTRIALACPSGTEVRPNSADAPLYGSIQITNNYRTDGDHSRWSAVDPTCCRPTGWDVQLDFV